MVRSLPAGIQLKFAQRLEADLQADDEPTADERTDDEEYF